MALNIQRLVGTAFSIGKALVPDAFGSSTVRLGPVPVVNPTTDTASTTWAHTITDVDLLEYDNQKERDSPESPEGTLKTFALQGSLVPAGAEVNQTGQIESAGTIWQIYRTSSDPAGGLFLLFARR